MIIKKTKKEMDIVEKRIKNLEIAVNILNDYVHSNDYIGKGRLVKCKKCGYIWRSKSLLKTITCSSCKYINKIEEALIKHDKI